MAIRKIFEAGDHPWRSNPIHTLKPVANAIADVPLVLCPSGTVAARVYDYRWGSLALLAIFLRHKLG